LKVIAKYATWFFVIVLLRNVSIVQFCIKYGIVLVFLGTAVVCDCGFGHNFVHEHTLTIPVDGNYCDYFWRAKMGNEVSVEEKNADVEMGSSTNINPQQLEILKNVLKALGKKNRRDR
jgi:hypothetical protein